MSAYSTHEQGYNTAFERVKEEIERLRLPGPGASSEWNEGWREGWRDIEEIIRLYGVLK